MSLTDDLTRSTSQLEVSITRKISRRPKTFIPRNGCRGSILLTLKFAASVGSDAALRRPDGAAPSLPVTQRTSDSIQAFGEHFVVHAHADAKVIGHFEKPTWNY